MFSFINTEMSAFVILSLRWYLVKISAWVSPIIVDNVIRTFFIRIFDDCFQYEFYSTIAQFHYNTLSLPRWNICMYTMLNTITLQYIVVASLEYLYVHYAKHNYKLRQTSAQKSVHFHCRMLAVYIAFKNPGGDTGFLKIAAWKLK